LFIYFIIYLISICKQIRYILFFLYLILIYVHLGLYLLITDPPTPNLVETTPTSLEQVKLNFD